MFPGCEFNQTLARRVSVCDRARFGLMHISCWKAAGHILFGPVRPVGPVRLVTGQISVDLRGLLLRII